MLIRCQHKDVEPRNVESTLLPCVRITPLFLMCLGLLVTVAPEPTLAFATTRTSTRTSLRNDQPNCCCLPRTFRHCNIRQPTPSRISRHNAHAISDELTDTNPPEKEEEALPSLWPCLDELDRKLIKIALPVIANFAINPLIGAVDLFWINRMGNALAVAGQAAANQVRGLVEECLYCFFCLTNSLKKTYTTARFWTSRLFLSHV